MRTSTIAVATPKDLRFAEIEALIVKVTHRCNLDCSYCYEDVTKTGKDMELSVFRKLVDRVFESIEKETVQFIFHGGEPTLVSNDWYEEAINYAISVSEKYNKRATFSIQTNLVRLTDDKIALFKKYKIGIGVSIDEPSGFGDSMRGKSNMAIRNFKRLQKEKVAAGILMTINQANYNMFEAIMNWLETEMLVDNVKVNVVSSVGKGDSLFDLLPEQIFEAQHSILEYMLKTKGKKVIEKNLERDLRRFFATDEQRNMMSKTLCNEKGCGAGKRVLGITPNGEILPCGRFQWNDNSHFLSNIENEASKDNIHSNKVYKFHTSVPENWLNCESCQAKKICNYGCQAFIVRSKSKINVECLPTKMKYDFFENNAEKLKEILEFMTLRSNVKKALKYKDSYHDVKEPYNDSDYRDSIDTETVNRRVSMASIDYTDTYNDGPEPYNDYADSNYADYTDHSTTT